MSLDFHLEADNALSISQIAECLTQLGVTEVMQTGDSLQGAFPSGLSLEAEKPGDPFLGAEDTKGLSFPVAMHIYLRVKSPEPKGLSQLDDLEDFITRLASLTEAQFLVTFQYESLYYWKDANGLHQQKSLKRSTT
ncbi:hypothetical protein [Gallaecimonas pentaromativorans]|uniref:hypothetical protein n=1 Tax=Gallaecimonas pentaromativorans TaxID=584787 RepID=UPI003A8E17E7